MSLLYLTQGSLGQTYSILCDIEEHAVDLKAPSGCSVPWGCVVAAFIKLIIAM